MWQAQRGRLLTQEKTMNATENDQRRMGAEWAAFLAKYRICGIAESGDGYDVKSTSGHTYHVHNEARIARDSASMYFTWHCNCQCP